MVPFIQKCGDYNYSDIDFGFWILYFRMGISLASNAANYPQHIKLTIKANSNSVVTQKECSFVCVIRLRQWLGMHQRPLSMNAGEVIRNGFFSTISFGDGCITHQKEHILAAIDEFELVTVVYYSCQISLRIVII